MIRKVGCNKAAFGYIYQVLVAQIVKPLFEVLNYSHWLQGQRSWLARRFEQRLAAGLVEVEKYSQMSMGHSTLLSSVPRQEFNSKGQRIHLDNVGG